MSDFEHFLELRKKYFGETATPQEAAEYISLYKSGKFAEVDEHAHEEIWNLSRPLSAEDQKLGEDIHADLIENYVYPSRTRSLQRRWAWLSAAAAILVFTVIGIWKYQDSASETPLLAQSSLISVTGPFYVKLPDNSSVELKAGSTLTYDRATFGTKDRQLRLSGTAFFDVTHNQRLPFRVQSGRVLTTVLGTAFNVRDEGGVIDVTVVRGKVSVGDSMKTFSTILPSEKITVSTKTMTYVTRKVNPIGELEWKEKNLILDELTMGEAMKIVEKRFSVKITIENSALNSCPISGYFVNNESLTQIMDVLCKLKQATYFMSGSNIVVHGGAGCNTSETE